MLLSSFTCVRVYSHNAALCPVSAPLCPLVSPCVSSVSSHSRQSVREPVEPRIVKHPRLETQHPAWEMTQSGGFGPKRRAPRIVRPGQLPQFGERGRPGVGWFGPWCSAGEDFLHPSVLRSFVCPPRLFSSETRRLLALIPILHAPNVPVSPSHWRRPLILVCVARGVCRTIRHHLNPLLIILLQQHLST